MDLYQQYIHKSRYARWDYDKKRRENWDETVMRYVSFMEKHLKENFNYEIEDSLKKEMFEYIYSQKVMPSMRALMTAGKALERENLSQFNCSYMPIDSIRAFDEAMYILMCGVGLGFSVERQYVSKLPEVPEELYDTDTVIVVADSKLGWAKAYKELIAMLYAGQIPKWDTSKIRPAGAPLKVFGGRASGPQALVDIFKNTINVFKKAVGRKLNSAECSDIMCYVAKGIIVGGVRRCLLGTDDVLTNRGIKKISDLVVGDEVLTQKNRFRKVLAKNKENNKKVYKITTNVGELFATENHRWAVAKSLNGKIDWVETTKLENNKSILIHNSLKVEGIYQDFPKNELFNMPKLDKDMAWFIGYFLGNGSCSKRYRKDNGYDDNKVRVSYPTNVKYFDILNDKIIKSYENLDVNSGFHDKQNAHCREIASSRSDITNYFFKYIKQPNTNISIPKFIKENTSEIRASFLSGLLDSDGSVRNIIKDDKGTSQITLVSTKYESFAREVQSLYSSLGIPTKFSRKVREGKSTEYIVKTVNTKFLKSVINLLEDTSIKLKNDYVLTEGSKDISGLVFTNELLRDDNKFISIRKYEEDANEDIPFIPILVKSVEFSHEDDVYDIQVDEDECFYVNGILTHNSALICLSNLSDERMRNYKTGQWWVENPQRALANISVAYTETPEIGIFMKEWQSLYESKSGERGIFNRIAVKKQLLEKCPDRDSNADYGVNPCIVGDTLIAVADDRGYVPIKTLVDNGEDNIPVLCFNKVGKVVVRNMINPRITQKNAKVYNVEFMDTKSVSVTSNHKFLTASGKYKSVNDLKPGDELISYEDNDINNKDIRNIRRECKLYGDAIDKFNEFSENELIDNFNKAKHYFPDNNISIKDNKVYITKQCESCEKEYDVEYGNHEVCFCSDKCYKKYYSEKKDTQFIDKKYIVSEIEWRGKVNYSRLKIRNITFIGKQDVYNGTVEEYHNYFTKPCSSYGISGYSGYYSLVNNANCGEIILKQIYQSESSKEGNKSSSIGGGLCNLSEVMCRENDTFDDLKSKVRIATILGTFQSTLTDFKYLRKGWKINAEEERLLGVSLSGIMDCKLINIVNEESKNTLKDLHNYTEEVNKEWAKKLGINPSKAICAVKPAGSTSQLNNTSSGLHSRFAKYYLRTVRNDSKDPLSKFMKEKGFYWEQDKMNPTNDVFYFPIKSPDNCILAKDENAIQQLEKYLMFKNYWCHHNPSITVYVKEHEWLEVAAFVYKNFDDIIGVTFLPYSDHIYEQAPYQEIDEETYIKWLEKMPKEINWDELSKYEEKDYTTSSQELSCFGGACEINF